MSPLNDKMSHPAKSPLAIVIYYAVLAALWILLTSYLFRMNIQDPQLIWKFELFKGIVFVIITSGLLYLALRKQQPPKSVNIEKISTSSPRRLLLLFISILLLIPLIVTFITFIEKPRLEQAAFQEREAIAELKATQIENWFKERHNDTRMLSQDHDFISKAQRLIQNSDVARQELEARLNAFRNAYGYDSVTLLHPDKEPVLHIGKPRDVEHTHWNAPATNQETQSIRQSIYRDEQGELHLDFITPLILPGDNPQRVGFLLLHMPLMDFIFPYVQRLSLGNKTDETLLVREENGKVQFLSRPRFSQSPALDLSRDLLDTDLPSALALRQQEPGRYHGIDYRDVPVFAATHPVANTDWQLIAKIDRKEVMQPLYELIYWVTLVSLFALLTIGISLFMVWRQQYWLHNLTLQVERSKADNLLQLFHDMPFVGICTASPQSRRLLRFNDRLCEILGYSRVELEKLTWEEMTLPDDLDQEHIEFDKVIRNESDGYKLDKRYIRKDGSIIYGYLEVKAIRGADGEVDYFIGMVQDIDDRKKIELALETAHHQAQHYLDIAGTMLVSLDTGGRIRMLNRKAQKVLAYSEDELLGKDWFEHCLPESVHVYAKGVFNKLMHGDLETTEYAENRVVSHNGEERLIAWHNSTLYDEKGNITGFLSSGEDITDIRAAQEELEASQLRLQTLFQTIPDLIWLKDTDGIYLRCNPMFEQFFGASEADIIGKTDYDFVNRQLADFFREHDRKALASNKPLQNEEQLTFSSNGYQGIFETTKTPMFDKHGELVGVLGIAHDITEREKAAAQVAHLSRLYATLSQTNQAIVRIQQESDLLERICHNAVEYGGYKMAWIGTLNQHTRTLTPIASAGEGTEYLDEILLSLDPQSPGGQGPTATALRENRPYWCQDFLHEPISAPWHEQAEAFGFAASASLPVWRNGKLYGNFNLYSEQANSFDATTQDLLQEMALDITFALENIDRETERQKTQQRLDLVIQGSTDAPWDWDFVNNELYYSPQWWYMLGYEVNELSVNSELWRRLAHPEDISQVEQALYRTRQPMHDHESVECRFQHKDGHYVPTLIRGIISRDNERKPIRMTGTIMDLTEQKAREAQLQEQVEELNRWFAATIGREERIIELKREVNALLQKHQQAPRYTNLDDQESNI
ncbi:PAS domain S-box protein [Thiohalophilus thiocyanatoxydans]|uniref:histidine kinase n=1 Tax=Thiohalophilus thiocyanatoxydans TaxID=381308 RepID=A0A4R8IJF3_9GAMM|nr:PAS domain S-box protein [Thiohalophilus thiocyanatoxydans]TDX98178.1 PAS domain S-box-containing protein [Thiohalophilus thiocyanatoxydans]